MKLKALALTKLKNEDIMNIKSISYDKKYNNDFQLTLNNKQINKNQNQNNKKLFKNYALLKSLSINTNDVLIPRTKVYQNNTLCSNYNLFKSNYSLKKRPKTFKKLIAYINDEYFFCTAKSNKRFIFPNENIFIKNSRMNHDINFFNYRHIITDYTKEYEKNFYKIKNIINQDIFVNKIKKDLLTMRYGNRIKLFNNL